MSTWGARGMGPLFVLGKEAFLALAFIVKQVPFHLPHPSCAGQQTSVGTKRNFFPPKEAKKRDPPRPVKEPHKGELLKKGPLKDTKRIAATLAASRRDAQPRKEVVGEDKEASPLGVRKMSMGSRTSSIDGGQMRPLRRSTSTDSGLYEEVGSKKKEVNPLHSPPPVRVTPAPPRPSRPKISPALPSTRPITNSKSPSLDRKTSLKATISGPLPLQQSPASRRRSDAPPTTSKTMKSNHTIHEGTKVVSKVPLSGSRSPAKPASRPIVRRGDSDELINSHSKPTTRGGGAGAVHEPRHLKKTSVPDSGVGDLNGHRRGGTRDIPSSSPRLAAHNRRGSADSHAGNIYKSELAKKLSGKTNSSTLSSTGQPKRPSPPNRPKAPPPTGKSQSSGPKPRTGPSRPHPPKVVPGKRPPPPRPYQGPSALAKKPVYVTIGNYTGEDTSSCLTFKDGEEVEVVEKSNDGWWFVKMADREGWAPSTYIEEKQPSTSNTVSRPYPPRPKAPHPGTTTLPTVQTDRKLQDISEDLTDSTPKPRPRPRPRKTTVVFYRAIDSYDIPSYEDAGLALVQGRLYELKEKADTGWWLMKDGDTEGWAPASYFKLA